MREEISQAILELDPQIKLMHFLKIDEMKKVFDKVKAEGKKPVFEIEEVQLMLVVMPADTMGPKPLALMEEWSLILPTRFVVTTFDQPTFKMKQFSHPIVANIIFKPIDKLIAKQHFAIALSGNEKPKANVLQYQKTEAQVEMLKDVQVHSVSELGFTTFSDRVIEPGQVSKYYSDFFEVPMSNSFFAISDKCDKSTSPEGEYLTHFRFVGLSATQVAAIRRLVFATSQKDKSAQLNLVMQLENQKAALKMNCVIIDSEKMDDRSLDQILENSFQELEIHRFATVAQFLNSLKEKPINIDFMMMSYSIYAEMTEAAMKAMLDQMASLGNVKNPTLAYKVPFYIYSYKDLSEDLLRQLGGQVQDVFFAPFDRIYVSKRLKQDCPSLVFKEPKELSRVLLKRSLQAANPIHVTEVSEGGLIFKYHREINEGEFRKFVFWMPNQIEFPQFLSQAHYNEKISGDKEFTHSVNFVFFGMSDHFLKFMRVWLLHSYIDSKSESQS